MGGRNRARRRGFKLATAAVTLAGVLALGLASIASGTGFQICTVAANCQAGTVGGLGGELNNPVGVAVDGSGNV